VLASPSRPKAPGDGPTPAEFVAAAQGLPPEMREQMVGRMIARSDTAVAANPKDMAAWLRLVTGYRALGRSPEATEALKRARAALAGEPTALAELDALGKTLGLPAS
jgi:cytochrome c-type biogenesis protein CcmH